ncbi:MAG: hypothetical protein ITG00_07575 [Flavobacterium sp.]|nr:hypothetical protein [Flavobacterium sp.]
MKNTFLLVVAALLLSCSNDEGGLPPLPAATQTGERTFGCLVDGVAFIHDSNVINCYYQYVDGEYYFGIKGDNYDNNPVGIDLGTSMREIAEGETYQLRGYTNGNAWGSVFFQTSPTNGMSANTSEQMSGELTITRLDFSENIVSGSFWFNVTHPTTGETVEITQGRFDTFFTE